MTFTQEPWLVLECNQTSQWRSSSPGTNRTFVVLIESGERVVSGDVSYPPPPPPPTFPLGGLLRIRVETDVSQETAIANASLIAALPALYETCKAILANDPSALLKATKAMQEVTKAQERCLSLLTNGA